MRKQVGGIDIMIEHLGIEVRALDKARLAHQFIDQGRKARIVALRHRFRTLGDKLAVAHQRGLADVRNGVDPEHEHGAPHTRSGGRFK